MAVPVDAKLRGLVLGGVGYDLWRVVFLSRELGRQLFYFPSENFKPLPVTRYQQISKGSSIMTTVLKNKPPFSENPTI